MAVVPPCREKAIECADGKTRTLVTGSDVSLQFIEGERAVNRTMNNSRDNCMDVNDPKELSRLYEELLDVQKGYTEARPRAKEPGSYATAIVISESQDVRFRDPEFGDMVLVAHSRCVNWYGFWRTSTLYSGPDNQVVLCNGDESRCVSIPVTSEIIIFDFEEEEREESRHGLADQRVSFLPGVIASYSEMLALSSSQQTATLAAGLPNETRKRNVRHRGDSKTRGRR